MEDFNEKAVISRIIELRTKYAGSRGKSKFARALGISPSTYSYYENNRLPPIPVLLRICQVAGTDMDWLLTGTRPNPKTPQDSEMTDELAEKLHFLLQKSPDSKRALMAFIELLNERNSVEKTVTSKAKAPRKTSRPGWIPVLGRTAAGMVHFWHQTQLPGPKEAIVELDELVEKHTGRAIIATTSADLAVDLKIGPLVKDLKTRGANLIQLKDVAGDYETGELVEFIDCQEIHSLFPDAFALQIDGDSMSPRINDSDIVILSPSIPAAQGHVAVARIAEQIGVTCKLIRTTQSHVHLIPINEKYDIKAVPAENLLWALAVLCHIRI